MWRRVHVPIRLERLHRSSKCCQRVRLVRYFGDYSATESELEDEVSTKEELIEFFENEGLSLGGINYIFRRFPEVTKLDVENDLREIVNFLKTQDFEVPAILEANPLILDRDPKYMLQIMEFMTGTGIEGEKLKDFIRENPEFLTVEYKNLYWVKAFLEDELGFADIQEILEEVPELALKSESEVRSNADLLHQIGLSRSEIVDTVPWVLVTPPQQLKDTCQFMFDLVGVQQKRVFTLCPELLDYSQTNIESKLLYLHDEGHNVRNILLNEPGLLQATLNELKESDLDSVLENLLKEQGEDGVVVAEE